MNRRCAHVVTCLLAAALIAAAPAKEDKEDKKEKDDSKASAAAAPKVYRFLAQKKGNFAGAQAMVLDLEDVFTNKKESIYVPNNDPASKQYDPLSSVVTALEEIEPGTAVQIETEKQKGRPMITSITKADAKPGEEHPNGFVFVESKEDNKAGMPSLTVTLSKFGREVKVGVPMVKDKEKRDAEWKPDPKIDYHVRRAQSGDVVEARFKPGRMPMLTELYPYETPERGTFIGLKEVEFNGWPAGGFEIEDEKGTKITFTLEGTEQTRNGQTLYVPDQRTVQGLKKIKPDTPVEVRYRVDRTTWIAREVKILKDDAKPAGKSSKEMDEGKMKEEKPEKQEKEATDEKDEKTKEKTKEKPKAGKAAKG